MRFRRKCHFLRLGVLKVFGVRKFLNRPCAFGKIRPSGRRSSRVSLRANTCFHAVARAINSRVHKETTAVVFASAVVNCGPGKRDEDYVARICVHLLEFLL